MKYKSTMILEILSKDIARESEPRDAIYRSWRHDLLHVLCIYDCGPAESEIGLVGSVKEAAQQVEETRMLAERGMYLATRLPLMTGWGRFCRIVYPSGNPEDFRSCVVKDSR